MISISVLLLRIWILLRFIHSFFIVKKNFNNGFILDHLSLSFIIYVKFVDNFVRRLDMFTCVYLNLKRQK